MPPLVKPFVGPGRTLAGPGAAASAGAELRASGVAERDGAVLVVADVVVLDLGLAGAAIESVRAAGFDVDVRPGVGAEPTPDTIRQLVSEEPGREIAAVVAVGGGSAIDAAKIASVATRNRLTLTAGLQATADVEPGPPILAIPTTAGTGAEATAVAMLWHDGAKRMFVHSFLVPRAVVLDPELLVSVPAPVTAAGGLDAISHAVESLLSTFRTPLSESAGRSALARLGAALPRAYANGDDVGARYETMLGAFEAGLALNASVVLGHSLAYVIAGRAGLPHGVSCAMALPYCLAHARPAREDAIAEMAEIVCGTCDADALVRWLVDANDAMGIPRSLADVGIDANAIPEMAAECAERYPRPNHPTPIDAESLEQLFAWFHAGDPSAAWNDARSLV